MSAILILDDDVDTQELVRLAFKDYSPSIEVRTATSCLEALKIMDRGDGEPVECVFIDQRLSRELSGTECVKRMRERRFDGAIVILTGYLEERVVSEAIRFGADDFIVKQADMRAAVVRSYEGATLRRAAIRQNHETTKQRFLELEHLAVLLDSALSSLRQHLKTMA